ncbi:MAG: hypothetical protein P4N60_21760, partial [Verrucomicrobiae bacterium]|nr:hypothetical protein [Verrucomicrobiae bacterium]
ERRERERAQEQADAEARQAMAQALEPLTRQFQREKLTDLFNRPDLASQMEACREAKEWLGSVKTSQ